ncbi:MAG TPA: efflux RND transporter permease subunit [Terriglobales bacterium]|nr:efflux RND transporter permease subunit [Terriglobales bacterium]
MGAIRAALRRPYTVMVLAAALVGAAVMAVTRMPIDVFPRLDVPVIYVAQTYGGMSPAEMEGYIVNYYESNFLFISGLDRIESRSIQNVALIKMTFHPGTDMSQAASETAAYISRALAYMPPGTVPPFIMRYDAGSVPVGDLILSSPERGQAELDDLAQTRVRPLFSALPGVSAPPPFGGNPRSIILDLDQDALAAHRLAPDDVVRALTQGNVVLPAGNLRMGDLNRIVHANTVVSAYQQLLDLPLRTGAGPPVLMRDVARVEDAADVISGYAELNGKRVVYMPVTKHAEASTLRVVNEVKRALPLMAEQVPPDVRVQFAFDQSTYVREALQVLLLEGLMGAGLTGLVVWLFLRDGRSSLIVVLTIPFALLGAVAGLWALGQSLNVMTLGGLALAVGILVDEATVAVENIHAHLARGGGVAQAVIAAGGEIVAPQALAMLSVAAVFLPSVFMVGISRSLFVPLAIAVGLAMLVSFVLSVTLVPVLAVVWLRHRHPRNEALAPQRSLALWQGRARRAAGTMLARRRRVIGLYLGVAGLLLAGLVASAGTDVFPAADTGQFQMRLRAAPGTRLKRAEAVYQAAAEIVRREAGPGNVVTTLGFVGTQPRSYPVNNIYLWTSGPNEAVMQVALRPGAGLRLARFEERLRRSFARELAGASVSFEAGDIIGQIMNLGSPAPIAINVTGFDLSADHAYAERIRRALAGLPELRDVQYGQPYEVPAVLVEVDRQRAAEMGISLAQVGRSLTVATASSRFVARNFWQNPATGITYQVQLLVPPAAITSLDQLAAVPLAEQPSARDSRADPPSKPILLGDVARLDLGSVQGEFDHFDMQRMVSLTANIYGASLGAAARDVQHVLRALPPPPRGTRAEIVGQVQPMLETLAGLRVGLALAVLVILLLLTASFQSWRLALTVLSSVPALLVGALLALRLFGSTLNIESFMGLIMAIGISVANGILLVTVAESRRREHFRRAMEPAAAARAGALDAVESRLRPILMTATAMIAGMTPMALALESGGEQSAPLGQAVIGGLLAATAATLLLMPAVFAALQQRQGLGVRLDED